MNIVSAKYMSDNINVEVLFTNGNIAIIRLDLPPDEQFRRMLIDWKNAGNIIQPYVAPPKPIPTDVGKLHFIRALRQLHLKTLFDTILANAGDDINEDFGITNRIVRSDPMTIAFETVAKQNGVTEAQINDVFILANEMETGNV